MFQSIATAFLLQTPAEPLTKPRTSWPMLSVVLACNVAILASLLSSFMAGAVVAGIVLVGLLVQNGRPGGVLTTSRSRRLASVVFTSALAALVPLLFGLYAPERCAVLAPGLFITAWPITLVLVALGGRLAARVAAQEGWTPSGMSVEGLGALALLAAMVTLVLAGSSTCSPQLVVVIAHAMAVVLGSVAVSGLWERQQLRA